MTQAEFEAILADFSKRIEGDLVWKRPGDGHRLALTFRVEVESDPGYPLLIQAWYNRLVPSATFALIHKPTGRIYGLCLGREHHNPSCSQIGSDMHKHRWVEATRDKEAYLPTDITASANNPNLVWQQFCRECNVHHEGMLQPPPLPPTVQGRLF